MKKFLVLGFVINIILATFVFKLFGLIFSLGGAFAIYKVMITKFPSKSEAAERLMFLSAYIMGVIAIHNLFQDVTITFVAGLIESLFYIFTSLS